MPIHLPPGTHPEEHLGHILLPPADADVWFFSLANLRIPGVLQRIGVVYFAVAVLIIQTRSRWRFQAMIAAALLLFYWGLMSLAGL